MRGRKQNVLISKRAQDGGGWQGKDRPKLPIKQDKVHTNQVIRAIKQKPIGLGMSTRCFQDMEKSVVS